MRLLQVAGDPLPTDLCPALANVAYASGYDGPSFRSVTRETRGASPRERRVLRARAFINLTPAALPAPSPLAVAACCSAAWAARGNGTDVAAFSWGDVGVLDSTDSLCQTMSSGSLAVNQGGHGGWGWQ